LPSPELGPSSPRLISPTTLSLDVSSTVPVTVSELVPGPKMKFLCEAKES
jgi:hypothetical protein